MSATRKILKGPGGLRVVLDRNEVYPDDPGHGTPALVVLGTASASYWCVLDQGEIDGPGCPVSLSDKQRGWLDSVEEHVDEFLYEEGSV